VKDPVLIIDGLNFFMRHFVVNPAMSSHGEHVGGFLGFFGGLGRLCEMFSPGRIVVVWESGGSPKKRAVDSSYKSGRRPPRLNRYYEDDIPATSKNHGTQVAMLVKALSYLPVTQIYVRDCEADDVIGYLGRYTFKDTDVILVSSDKDLYQLIDDTTVQWSPGQKKIIDQAEVVRKFGVSSENFCTARVFVGDSSDNITGVKGAGFGILSRWFPQLSENEFVSHGEVVEQARLMCATKKGKVLQRLAESGPTAAKNWKLMFLDTSKLAGDQIKKVTDQIEKRGTSDKMSLLKMMVHHGIQKFDIDRHFLEINSVRNK
jgi:DNA polymerase-1